MQIYKKWLLLIPIIIFLGSVAFFSPSLFLGKWPTMDNAEGADGVASSTPNIIILNKPSNVTVMIKLTDTRLIAGSVNLQRLDASGKAVAVLGTLNDTGTNGDTVAGDKIFTVKKTFNEATTTPVRLQASWALKGVLKRSSSNILTLSVLADSTPEATLSAVVTALRNNNTEGAITFFSGTDKAKTAFSRMNQTGLNALMHCFQDAHLVTEADDYRVYQCQMIGPQGDTHSTEFIMSKNTNGQWYISSW